MGSEDEYSNQILITQDNKYIRLNSNKPCVYMILITGVQTPNVKIINLSQKITPVRNNLKLINLNVNKRKYKS